MKGIFITFEGVEGCGKSTQINLLQAHLESRGHPVEVTREPGGTALAEAIRALLLDPANAGLRPTAELLLYEAARAQHVEERIRPALDAGKIVLCDRFADSSTAYQGAGRNLPWGAVLRLHEFATGGIGPDLTIVIDVSPSVGLERARRLGHPDRLEREPLEFHERVRAGFLRVARDDPKRVKVVDGMQSIQAVAADVNRWVDALVGQAGAR